ncbi:MAG: glutamine amidotransferase class-I [Mucilaginibacter sp.]|nr:glutamine amidotransferase class-I [Mucilaginibacter sp.]
MRFLVFQHVPVEHPGVFRDYWLKNDISWTTVELDEGDQIPPDLTAYDAMVVMGGPMDVWQIEEHPWLAPEIAAIREFVVELGRPFLGVCLGHQLLAKALGGHVALASVAEVGLCPVRLTRDHLQDPLLHGFASPLTTFQWHGAEVKALPKEAVVLAETDDCKVQAFRWGGCAYGFQFHAEITATTVDDWSQIPAYKQSLENVLGLGASERLAAEAAELLPQFNATAKNLSDRFVGLVTESRRAALRSTGSVSQ